MERAILEKHTIKILACVEIELFKESLNTFYITVYTDFSNVFSYDITSDMFGD